MDNKVRLINSSAKNGDVYGTYECGFYEVRRVVYSTGFKYYEVHRVDSAPAHLPRIFANRDDFDDDISDFEVEFCGYGYTNTEEAEKLVAYMNIAIDSAKEMTKAFRNKDI